MLFGILAIKNNEIMPVAARWVDSEIVLLSEDREDSEDSEDSEKEKYHKTSLVWNLKRNDTNELTYKTCLQRDSQT